MVAQSCAQQKMYLFGLKVGAGRELVKQLMTDADVVIENFRPGVLEDWGLDPESLRHQNPRLIYARISGYGQTGPNAKKPGVCLSL